MPENEPLTIPSIDETRIYQAEHGYICIEQDDGLGNTDRVHVPADRVEHVVAFIRQIAANIRESQAQTAEARAIATYAGK